MNLAHLHLLLNHVPTIGFGFGIGLLVASLVRGSDDLQRASLVTFFAVALLAIPAYLTGSAAHFVLRGESGVVDAVVAAHQEAAMLSLIPMEITGYLAWLALLRFRRWTVPAVLALSVVTFVLVARAANLGGQIRHPEILAGAPASVPGWPSPAAFGTNLIVNNPWVWPICEVFHFVGLCLLFGVVLLVNLRLLGILEGVPIAAMNRLLPWAMAGLGINIVTGLLFFLAVPDQYTQNRAFAWKIGLLLPAAMSLLYPTLFEEDRESNGSRAARLSRGIVAAASIAVWIGVIFLGRYLPYLGTE